MVRCIYEYHDINLQHSNNRLERVGSHFFVILIALLDQSWDAPSGATTYLLMNNITYFILTREIFESAIWLDNPHILKLFIFLVGNARYQKEPKKYPGFEVKCGEYLTSLAALSEANEYMERGRVQKWSRAKVSRMLETLVKQEYIKLLTDTYGTHITICNYELYQDHTRYQADRTGHICNGSATGVCTVCNASENNSNKVKKGKKVKEVKHIYGVHKKVRLTQIEYDRWEKDFGATTRDQFIKRLDHYIATNKKGQNYTDHNKVIRGWKNNDEKQGSGHQRGVSGNTGANRNKAPNRVDAPPGKYDSDYNN